MEERKTVEDLGLEANQGHTWYWKAKLRLLACTFVLCANFAASRDVKEAF